MLVYNMRVLYLGVMNLQCMCWCFYIILPTGTYAEATTEPLVTTYDEAESVLDVQE